ncbi:hypothetical protein LXL04_016012 [Taraxacum kok-saghyz]
MDSYTSPPPSSLIILFKRIGVVDECRHTYSIISPLTSSRTKKKDTSAAEDNQECWFVLKKRGLIGVNGLRQCENKDGSGDPSFPVIKDQNQFSVSHARYSKNPIARWHICQGSINSIAFSSDGAYIAIVGSDGAYIAINRSLKLEIWSLKYSKEDSLKESERLEKEIVDVQDLKETKILLENRLFQEHQEHSRTLKNNEEQSYCIQREFSDRYKINDK